MDWKELFEDFNYYVTQLLSGHGYFRKYLHKMVKTAFPYCLYEEGEIIDDAEYTVGVTNIVGVMIPSRENWTSVANYVERILMLKKRDLEAAEHVGMPV